MTSRFGKENMDDKKKEVVENTEIVPVEITEELLKEKLYEVRGVKVMLDSDLAEIYGYTTKALNQQVKNNQDRFDNEFTFKLTRDEWKDLRSKNLTSSWGGSRYLPNVFTEQGVYMLMTILKGELAAKQSKDLVKTFKKIFLEIRALSVSARLCRFRYRLWKTLQRFQTYVWI